MRTLYMETQRRAGKVMYEPPLDDDIATGKADICPDCDCTHEEDESCIDSEPDVMYSDYYED